MTKELQQALEEWERDGAKKGMEGRQAPGGTRTGRLLEAYRAYLAAPQCTCAASRVLHEKTCALSAADAALEGL